ncbi:MAG: outer membrane lipoprotein carrier protein LolA [Candidatus Aureabacteria bacterium]|nr:outer membrane lipoprotein carrier protein LolA [Candidatus Auribacterota bacterium]
MRRNLVLVLLIVAAGAGIPWPASDAADLDTAGILKKMEEAGTRFTTLQADFRQERIYSLFDEKRESSGTIFYKKPSAMLWKYNPPDNTMIYLKERRALMYLPDIKQAQKISLAQDRKTETLLIGFGNTAEEIRRNFTVVSSPGGKGRYTLDLTPKTDELASHFQRLRLVIDGERWLPVRSERFERGGDRTVFTFSNFKVGVTLKDELFDFKVPAGVEVVEY